MSQDTLKKAVAEAALSYVQAGTIVGIGTGSTANFFIDALAAIKHKIDGTVASSVASAERLKKHGIPVLALNSVDELALYVDGADEATKNLHLIKGGGGAQPRGAPNSEAGRAAGAARRVHHRQRQHHSRRA